MRIPDRALIPLLAAISAGFIAGLIAAVKELSGSDVWALAVPVGVLVAICGMVSVIKAPGEEAERWIVGGIRTLCAVACYGFLFAGFIRAVRDGKILGLLFFIFAAVFGALLTRFRVRDRGELRASGESEQGPTTT